MFCHFVLSAVVLLLMTTHTETTQPSESMMMEVMLEKPSCNIIPFSFNLPSI